MRRMLRTFIAIPALLGVLAGGTALPSDAHANPYGGRPGWGGHGPRGPGWGGRGPGWGPHNGWRRDALVGGLIGGLAVGALAGVAVARPVPPPVAYGPPPPPVYVAPTPVPYAAVVPAPVYGPYNGW